MANDNEIQIELDLGDLKDLFESYELDLDPTKVDNRTFWLKYGDCPVCRNKCKPECVRGLFICRKCSWNNMLL
jgi:hypothetical protein